MKKASIIFLLFISFTPIKSFGNDGKAKPLLNYSILWTGYYYNSIRTPEGELPSYTEILGGGTFYQRGNIYLTFPAMDLGLRFMATDKRTLPFTENDNRAGFNPAIGIYHEGSNSRFLYGVQNEYGLPARISNIWQRSLPYMDARSPSSRDLKPEPSSTDEAQTYLYLSLPRNAPINFFFSIALDDIYPAYGTGLGFKIQNMEFHLDAYHTKRTLTERKISTWFSSSPPLPERESAINALSFVINSNSFGIAADWAYSETFAYGKGLYSNFAIRIGNRPWRFSLTGDGASSRFVDRNGANTGNGFRTAVKLEHFMPRSGLLRVQGTFRSPGINESFNRANLSIYYRPSSPTAAERRESNSILRFNRASLTFNRDARNTEKILDTYDAMIGYSLGPLSGTFNSSIQTLSNMESLYSMVFFRGLDSIKFGGNMSVKPLIFNIGTGLAYTYRVEKDPIWEFSLNVSVNPGKWGRLGFRIASTNFPNRWNYTLSWRYNAN